MSTWLKRFGLHLAAAVGAMGIFVAAAAVGASQTHPEAASIRPAAVRTRTPLPRPEPGVVVASPAPSNGSNSAPAPPAARVIPERSLSGTITDVRPDGVGVLGVGGHAWQVVPVPGALIRLNGKAAQLSGLEPGDNVVILGQAQPGPGSRFLAHAITARRK